MKVDLTFIARAEIARLFADYPELMEEADLRADAIEGQTQAHEIMRDLVLAYHVAKQEGQGVKKAIEVLESRAKRHEIRAEKLRASIQSIMEAAHLDKLPLDIATLSMGNRPQSVTITDVLVIPDDFMRVKREPDKTAIKAALQEGAEVPGAFLSNGGRGLTIRII